jgi:hypothetical protein
LSRTGTRTARSDIRTFESEVGAAETCLIRRVHDDAEVADESWSVFLSRQVEIDVAVEYKCVSIERVSKYKTWETHFAEKLGPVMFPCLPERSPTSHLSG